AASRHLVRVGIEGDEIARPLDAIHDLVAGIDAEAAADALHLQPVAYVDAGRTDGNAGMAIDAVAAPFPALPLLVRAALLAAPVAIADGQRLLIDHRRLEARPGAHIGADLLARPAGQHVGRRSKEADERIDGDRRLAGEDLAHHGRRIVEIHDPG